MEVLTRALLRAIIDTPEIDNNRMPDSNQIGMKLLNLNKRNNGSVIIAAITPDLDESNTIKTINAIMQ
jgi:hypothetical protein